MPSPCTIDTIRTTVPCHCEERSDVAISSSCKFAACCVFNVEQVLDFGLFCLRRPHFLCRQEMGERSDSGEALTAVAIVPLLRSLLPCSPQSRPPPRPPPGRWRVSLLRGGRFLTERQIGIYTSFFGGTYSSRSPMLQSRVAQMRAKTSVSKRVTVLLQ